MGVFTILDAQGLAGTIGVLYIDRIENKPGHGEPLINRLCHAAILIEGRAHLSAQYRAKIGHWPSNPAPGVAGDAGPARAA